MDKSYFNPKLMGALALAILAGTALAVLLTVKTKESLPEQMASDTKNLAKKLSKKAKKNAKNLRKEEWLAQERDKIMDHIK
jgi:hypothetical protein